MNSWASASLQPRGSLAGGVASMPSRSIRVWAIDLRMDLESSEACLLDANELARCAAFTFERERRRFTRTRTALRATLGRELGIAPKQLALIVGPFGKPLLLEPTQIAFNVSHSDELALIAVGLNVEAVGIDLERYRLMPDATAMAATNFSADEREALAVARDPALRFLEIWTRKEAVIKALGLGLGSLNLTTLHVGYQGSLDVRVGKADVAVTTIHDVEDGYIASIAYVAPARVDINMMTPLADAKAVSSIGRPHRR